MPPNWPPDAFTANFVVVIALARNGVHGDTTTGDELFGVAAPFALHTVLTQPTMNVLSVGVLPLPAVPTAVGVFVIAVPAQLATCVRRFPAVSSESGSVCAVV